MQIIILLRAQILGGVHCQLYPEAVILIGKLANCHSAQSSNPRGGPSSALPRGSHTDRKTCKLPFCSELKSWGVHHQLYPEAVILIGKLPNCHSAQSSNPRGVHHQLYPEAVILIGKLANCHSAQSSNPRLLAVTPPDGTLLSLLFFSSMMVYYLKFSVSVESMAKLLGDLKLV